MDLFQTLEQLIRDLDTSVKMLRVTGSDYAQAESNYRMLLSEAILKLEAEGRPVTNLYNIARGQKEIAKAKYEQISKEAIYKANLESIQATKLKIKVIQAQIDKEWDNA